MCCVYVLVWHVSIHSSANIDRVPWARLHADKASHSTDGARFCVKGLVTQDLWSSLYIVELNLCLESARQREGRGDPELQPFS